MFMYQSLRLIYENQHDHDTLDSGCSVSYLNIYFIKRHKIYLYNNLHFIKINIETALELFDIKLTEVEGAKVGALRRHFCYTGSHWKLIRNFLSP